MMKKCRKLSQIEQAMEILNDQATSLNIIIISRISGFINPSIFTKAISLAQIRHPRLNNRIVRIDNNLHFVNGNIENSTINLPINIVETVNFEELQNIVLQESNQKIESDKYLARFTLIKSENNLDKNYLITTIHHAIADGLSSINLHSDIFTYYDKITLSEDISSIESLDVLPSVVELIPNLFVNNSFTKFINYSKSYSKSALFTVKLKLKEILHQPKSLGAKKHVPIESRRTGVICRQLESDLTQKIINSCRQQNTTVNSALNAAILKAVAEKINSDLNIKGRNSIRLSCQTYVDLRKRLKPSIANENLGILTSFINLFYTIKTQAPFWNLAKDIKKNLDFFSNRNDIYYPILMSKIIAKYYLSNPKEIPVSIVMTNVGKVNIPENYGSLKLEEISFIPTIRALRGVLGLAISTFNRKMFLNFMFSEPSISQETAEEIANQTIFHLTEACSCSSKIEK
ncbi:MAG: condensation domain-containing protein [Cyanobacteria bacterium P01_A01_bin.45]